MASGQLDGGSGGGPRVVRLGMNGGHDSSAVGQGTEEVEELLSLLDARPDDTAILNRLRTVHQDRVHAVMAANPQPGDPVCTPACCTQRPPPPPPTRRTTLSRFELKAQACQTVG